MAKKTENAPGAGKSGVPSIKEENRLPIQQILYKKTGNAVNMKQSEDMFSPNPLKTPDVIANMWRVRGEAKRDGMAILDQIRKEREQSGLTAARKRRDAAAKALDAHKNNRDKYRTADALANGSDGQAEYDAEKARLEKMLHQAAADYDTAEIGAMNDDERADLDTIAKEKGKSFWEKASVWSDADALAALNNPEGNEVFQQAEARKRLNRKYDDSRINQLAETRSRELNRQETDNLIQQTREQTDEHPILSNTGAVLANVVAGIAGTGDAAYSAIKQKLDPNGKYYAPDVNLPGYRAGQYVDAVRGRTSENILGEEPDFWAKAANTVYGLGTNAVDVGVRAAVSGGAGFVGAGLAATNTFQRSYRDAIQRDGNADKAAVYALTKAGIEYATNKISLDKLFSTKDPETIKQLLKNAFGQGVEEATQNEVEFLTGLFADAAIMGQNSEYSQTMGDMIASGMSQEDAQKQLFQNYAMQALETAASSGFAGFTMSVGNQLPGYTRNRIAGNLAKAQPAQTPEQTPQGDTLEQEAAAARAAQAAEQIGQDLKAQQDAQEAQQPAKPQLTDEEVQARVEAAMMRTAEDAKQKRLQQQVYEDLKAAQKEQKDLLRDIEKAEKKLKQTGKGSPARIEQMKAQLEQVNDLVRQIESQKNLFGGNYERTVAQAVSEQEQIFQQAKKRAADALNAYERGEITENQRDAEVNAYNNAGAELRRLRGMSQEEYRAELAEVGLIGDRANPELETSKPAPEVPMTASEVAEGDTQSSSPSYADRLITSATAGILEKDSRPEDDGVSPEVREDIRRRKKWFRRLTDEDAPPEPEERYPGTKYDTWDKDPFGNRSWSDVGKRGVKAFISENPEYTELYQDEASKMYIDLLDTQKGGRIYDEDLYYRTGGDKGWLDQKGLTSNDIASLRDSGMTYKQIEKGLEGIMEDHGKENNANSKRVEFQINERLLNGYKDFRTGERVPPNEGYIDSVNWKQEKADSARAFDALVQDADRYAPQQDTAEMQQNPENAAKMQRPQTEPEVRRQPVQEAQAQRPQVETPTKSYDEQRKNYTNAVNRMNDAMAAYEKGEISKKQLDAVIRAYKKESKELDRIRSQPEAAPNTEQKNIYMDSVKRLKDALDAYDRGEITNEQRDAALDAYTKESAELDRMRQGDVQESRPEPEVQSPPQAEPAVQMPKAEGQPLAQDVEGQTRRVQSGSYEADMEDVETKPPRPKRHKKAEPIPEMEEGNSVGPAEAGFTGKKTFNEIIGDGNVQRDRRDDVRPMDIPAKDVSGRKVSETAGNVYGSRFTPDEFADLMQEPAARGDLSYVPISNNDAVQKAQKNIERSGSWERAYAQWSQDARRGIAGAEMTARGSLLLNKAARDGNKALYMDILMDMRAVGTNTAQGLQAFRIIRNFTPKDELEFTNAVTRRLSQMYNTDVTISSSLLDAYQKAGTDAERAKIMGDIKQHIADQIPSTLLDKFNSIRYMNMLGNLKSPGKNVIGNLGNAAAYRMKDSVGSIIETVANKVSGGKVGRTKAMYVSPEQYQAAGKLYDEHAAAIATGGKFNTKGESNNDFLQDVMDRRRIFNSDVMEGARKTTDWMLNNKYFGDAAFGKLAFSRSLAGFLKANGVTETDFSKVDPKLMDRGIAYAVKQAQEATFHDNNKIASALGRMKRSAGPLGEGIAPFVKTPTNVLLRAEEFSPLGLINSTYTSLQKAAGSTGLADGNGALGKWAQAGREITGTDVVDSWAKTFTGVGIAFLGGVLHNAGLLVGGPDPDDEKAEFDKANGAQNYALRIGDGKTITIDFLSPVCMPLFMGQEIFKALTAEDQEFSFDYWERVITSIADPMIQMSMLQGLNDSLANVRYADNNLGRFLLNACTSYLTQGISSTLLGQLERSFEKNRMTTYIDKDSGTPVWLQQQLGNLSKKIPGWDYQQREYRDIWGNTQESGGLAYNLLSPGYISQERQDAVTKELNRLRKATGANVYPRMPQKDLSYVTQDGEQVVNHNLSMEELDTLQKVQGQTQDKMLKMLVQSDGYKNLTDQQKAKAADLVYEYAQEKGRQAAVPDYYSRETAWMAKMGKDPASVIAEKVAADSINDAMSETMSRYSQGWATGTADKELESAYQIYAKMPNIHKDYILDNLGPAGQNYVEARDAKIPQSIYMGTMRDLADLEPEDEGAAKANQKQRLDLVAGLDDLTENQKAIMAKQQISDAQDRNLEKAMAKGLSVEEFARLYRLHEDYTHGNGKKDRTIAKIVEEFDLVRKLGSKKAAYAEASALYDIFK